MRLLKVHQVKHMQDLGMTEAIDVDGTHIQVVVAKLSWAEYCVAPRLFFFFSVFDSGAGSWPSEE